MVEKMMLLLMVGMLSTQAIMFIIQIRMNPDWILSLSLWPRIYYVVIGVWILTTATDDFHGDHFRLLLSAVLFQFVVEITSLAVLMGSRWKGFRLHFKLQANNNTNATGEK